MDGSARAHTTGTRRTAGSMTSLARCGTQTRTIAGQGSRRPAKEVVILEGEGTIAAGVMDQHHGNHRAPVICQLQP